MMNDPFFHTNIYKAQERYQAALHDAEVDRWLAEPNAQTPWLARLGDGLIAFGNQLKSRYTQPQLTTEYPSLPALS